MEARASMKDSREGFVGLVANISAALSLLAGLLTKGFDLMFEGSSL